jgi:16S rRNA (cytidine1402-2'-O)-methyltransferase
MTLKNQMAEQIPIGCLYVVATPIGNLGDLSSRAIEVLKNVDWIAAEDTRHTRQLLTSLGLNNELLSLHEHNEQQRSSQLLEKLKAGEKGALVSDAGTPLINDPGYHLVNVLRQEDIAVVPIPGPSAVIAALSCAGLPTDRFTYEGFLPAKASKKTQVLSLLLLETRTMVFYESPHRMEETLDAFLEVFGEVREMVVGREITKKFEQFVSGSIREVRDYFAENKDKIRGEFVVMLKGAQPEVMTQQTDFQANIDGMIKIMLAHNLPVKQLSEIIADISAEKKKTIYQRALELKDA